MRVEPEIVAELKRIAGADEDELVIVHRGVTTRVRYRGDGGEGSLELRADYDTHARPAAQPHAYRDGPRALRAIRPMQIALRSEHSLDRHHKRQGLDVEYQTGDAAFDDAVYVDTPTVASVLGSVLSEDARRAVRTLLELGFDTVVIDDANGDVVATIEGFEEPAVHPPLAGTRGLHAFVDLVRALPQVERAAGRHAPNPLRTATGIAVVVSTASIFSAAHGCDVDHSAACTGAWVASSCNFARPLALTIGAVVAVAFGARLHSTLARRYSGRSSSSDRINALCVAASGTALAAAAYAVNHLLLR